MTTLVLMGLSLFTPRRLSQAASVRSMTHNVVLQIKDTK